METLRAVCLDLDDTLWPAEGPDFPVGTRVKVTAVEGTVLVVEGL